MGERIDSYSPSGRLNILNAVGTNVDRHSISLPQTSQGRDCTSLVACGRVSMIS